MLRLAVVLMLLGACRGTAPPPAGAPDLFPFTDGPETDGGVTDSMLARAKKDGVVPNIFYTNGSYEYWGRDAGLIHTSPDGKKMSTMASIEKAATSLYSMVK